MTSLSRIVEHEMNSNPARSGARFSPPDPSFDLYPYRCLIFIRIFTVRAFYALNVPMQNTDRTKRHMSGT